MDKPAAIAYCTKLAVLARELDDLLAKIEAVTDTFPEDGELSPEQEQKQNLLDGTHDAVSSIVLFIDDLVSPERGKDVLDYEFSELGKTLLMLE